MYASASILPAASLSGSFRKPRVCYSTRFPSVSLIPVIESLHKLVQAAYFDLEIACIVYMYLLTIVILSISV